MKFAPVEGRVLPGRRFEDDVFEELVRAATPEM